jgi:glycerophosphoryl diester phosphodiesterase
MPADGTSRIIELLRTAKKRAALTPVLSPIDRMVNGDPPAINVRAIQEAGFPVVVWTVNDTGRIRALLTQKVDGIISDRPDLLRQEALKTGSSGVDLEAHRGGRDLRPENTLPSFESGLDQLVTTLETDTGVTADHVSLISHEQFLNPQTCRRMDGKAYGEAEKIWIKDITMSEAASQFICDKVFRGPQQTNDLALSPVSVAFAREEQMKSPYSPTHVSQLYRFVSYYVEYYRSGPGKSHAEAPQRANNAAKVRFNLETKITPAAEQAGRTFAPEVFVTTLAGTIEKANMQKRSDIQSFDYRTLEMVENRFKQIRTVYLIESLAALERSAVHSSAPR